MATAQINRILGHLRHWSGEATDGDLLTAFLAGRDPAAFEAIVRRHGPVVRAACRRVLRHEADIEDAFQATFVVLLRNGQAIQNRQALGGWLFGVAHRVAVNARCRRAKREARERTNTSPPHPLGEPADLSWREACAVLHEELNRLPDKYRLPLLLCYLEGKSRDEAADELGWSAGAVKGALERGRDRLRGRLERRGIALSVGLLSAVAVGGASAVPAASVNSVVSFAGSGIVPPAVSTIAQGVHSMTGLFRPMLAVMTAAVAIGVGALIASTSPDAKNPPPPAKTAPAEVAKPAGDRLVVTGTVTDAADKPVAGAKLYVPYLKRTPPVEEADIGVKVIGTTAADGTFQVDVEKGEASRYLIVAAEGLAVGWADLEKATGTLATTVRLVKDLPMEGRVIDTEGKPVAGAAVKVMAVLAPGDGKLDALLTGWKNDWNYALRLAESRMSMPLASIHGSGKTDAAGRFFLKGVGAERIAVVTLSGAGYAEETFYVVARAGLDAGPINKAAHDKIPPALRIPGQPPTLSGPKVEVVLQAMKVIAGTVTDAATGKPMAGVMVTSGTGYGGHASATSGKDGTYRLTGLRKQKEYLVHTLLRNPKSPYLMWSARVRDTDGLSPIPHDIPMTKGVVVTGRILDGKTGNGVRGVARLAPLPDNKFFGTSPAYNGYASEHLSHPTEADGRFRLVTIPGTAVLLVEVESPTPRQPNPFQLAVPDPAHPEYFTHDRDDGSYRFTAAGNSLEFLGNAHVCQVVDLKPDAAETTIDLTVKRGATATLKIVDPDGKPVAGATITGVTASWPMTSVVPKDSTTVYALDPKAPRTLYVLHVERKLGGTVKIRGDEKEAVTVKLAPVGSIAGKLIDTDGRPIAGVTVGIQFPGGESANDLYRQTQLTQTPPKTDQDGLFRFEGILPSVQFYLSMTKGQEYFAGEPKIGPKEVKAGQILELGELKVKGRKFGE